jgi:hypothetical protein
MDLSFAENGYYIEKALFSKTECQEILKGIRSEEHQPPPYGTKALQSRTPLGPH